MDLRSTPMTEMTDGPEVRWLNGRWCYAWSDGTIIPAMYGFDNDDTGDEDDTDDTEDEDEDDDDDEEDEADKAKSSKSAQRASRQAAKYRTKAKTLQGEVDRLTAELTDAQTKLKDGAGDETAKARITELETENKQLKERLGEVSSTIAQANMAKQVGDLKTTLNIGDSEEFVLWLIESKSDLEADDDGEFDERELKTFLKRQLKAGKLSVASGDDDEDDDDEDDDESASGARTSSQRRFNGKKKQRKDGLDRASLEAKFPALRR